MKLLSPVFEHNSLIPQKYTCFGENVNPALEFNDIPQDTKSLVLIMDDPDAVSGTWVHWVIFNIPADTSYINENTTPPGAEGTTSFGKTGYGGPCPPNPPPHRYFFKLYALDVMFGDTRKYTKVELEEFMEGHILAKAELIGIFQKPQ